MAVFTEVTPEHYERAFIVECLIVRVIPPKRRRFWSFFKPSPPAKVSIRITDTSYRQFERSLGDSALPQTFSIAWPESRGALPVEGTVRRMRLEWKQAYSGRGGAPRKNPS